jgi:predicted CXXCH cytochrome family protein
MIAAIAAFLVYAAGSANAQSKPVLTGDDCLKCHATAPADLAAAGGKHQGVGCTGCHEGHPPTVKKPIPLCNQCHMGKPHFELKGCLGCHRNPHTPKKITFDSKVTDPCLTCHTPQIEQLKKFKSKHTALFCSTCHSSHGLIPQCTQCHKSHSADITAADCKKCHKPHMPTQVTYSADTPAKYCGSCHKKAFDVLTASGAKHKTFTCAFCHQEKHKMVPKCQDCHGAKHPAAIMAKFPKCGECHKVAHDLNNWTPEAAETTKQAPKKKK